MSVICAAACSCKCWLMNVCMLGWHSSTAITVGVRGLVLFTGEVLGSLMSRCTCQACSFSIQL